MVRRRDGLEKRDALLDAALRCFEREGVLGVGIETVRREAGASPSSVYNLFADLGDLTLALAIRTFERLFHHLAERVARTRSARGLVLALVEGHLEWILAHPVEGRFLYQVTALELGKDASARLLQQKAELLRPVVARFEAFVAEGSLPAWSPLAFDVVLLGPTHEACRRYLAGAPLDPEWMRRTLPRLAWKTVATEARRA